MIKKIRPWDKTFTRRKIFLLQVCKYHFATIFLYFLFVVDVKHNLRLILTIYNPYTYYII